MAKKRKQPDKALELFPKEYLPQNMIRIGEQEPEDKKVYIYQETYNEIHKFTKDKTKNESGGILVGRTVEEFGKTNIIIIGFVEAKHTEATPTTLTFTHESWDQIHEDIDARFPDETILGWIHTHPNFGIFLSEYDKFIQSNFFSGENQIAYVVDPIQDIEGFYVWMNGNIEKCKGFYIFDETDKAIEKEREKAEISPATNSEQAKKKGSPLFLAVILLVLIAVLSFTTLSSLRRISKLESTADRLYRNEQQLQNEIVILETSLATLRDEINEVAAEQQIQKEMLALTADAGNGNSEIIDSTNLAAGETDSSEYNALEDTSTDVTGQEPAEENNYD